MTTAGITKSDFGPEEATAAAKPTNYYMVSAWYDAILFIGSPLLALLLALALNERADSVATTKVFGTVDAAVGVFIAVWTFAHLFAVFFRSHGNPEIFSRFPLRFTVIPGLVFLGLYSSQWLMISGLVLAAFWDVYHTAMQNFGFCRIYDSRRGSVSVRARRLDIGLNQLLYVGPIVGGLSWADTVGILDNYYQVNWNGGEELANQLVYFQPQLTTVFISGGSIYLIYYLYSYWQLSQQGYVVSRQKILLLTSVGISSVWAWGFLHPFYAFFVANFYHGLQYFAIVWAVEKNSMQSLFRVTQGPRARLFCFLFFVLILTVTGELYRTYGTFSVQWGFALFTTVSLMHFWYDSFVWAAREVRAS